MDLTLELFLMQPCSVLAAAMLDSKDPLLAGLRVRPIGQNSSCGGEVHSEGGSLLWLLDLEAKISIQFKSTKCPLFRQLLINHVSMKISPFHEAVVWGIANSGLMLCSVRLKKHGNLSQHNSSCSGCGLTLHYSLCLL